MPGLDYLKIYSSAGTVAVYRSSVRDYLSFIYNRDIVNGELVEMAKSYFKEGRDYQADMDGFIQRNKDMPPKTKRLKMAAIKTYFVENCVEFPALYWKRLRDRVKGSRALTLDRSPSNVELKKILNLMPIQGKALYLVLSSSGMRIGEALQLTLNDIDMNAAPAKISIRGAYTKTGNSRIVFISSEAKESLDQWLRIRQDYINSAALKSWQHGKDTEDKCIFPFELPVAYSLWQTALRKAGLFERDSSTDRSTLHPHVLRKFFRTRMGAVIPVDIAEALMGHEGYLTEVYRKYSQEELAEFYKKGELSLMVFGNGQDLAKLKSEIDDKSKTLNEGMATLALKNERIEAKNADLENRLTVLISEHQRLKEKMDSVISLVDKLASKVEKMD